MLSPAAAPSRLASGARAVPVNVPLAGAMTPEYREPFTWLTGVPEGIVGSMATRVAEPLCPLGQATDEKVGVVVVALPAPPDAGEKVSPLPCPIVPTAACAWVVLSTAPPSTSAPTPAT